MGVEAGYDFASSAFMTVQALAYDFASSAYGEEV